ncbi:MAG: hypothetical protein IJR99_16690 [Kiritimatiellae bacterium]|nr:hypothetical protein [Kiritimatiellia bacterium]
MKKRASFWFFWAFAVILLTESLSFAKETAKIVPKPHWNVPSATGRMLIGKRMDDFFLATLPTRVGTSTVHNTHAYVSTNRIPCQTIWRDATQSVVLVDASSVKRGMPIRLYPVAKDKPETGPVTDPAPLRGMAARTAGMDFPTNQAGIRMLETRFDTAPVYFYTNSFDALPETFKSWYRGDWQRKSHLVRLQTWLLVPTNTVLQFGLAGGAPAWLSLDGRDVMEHPPYLDTDKWSASRPTPVKSGLRKLEVVTVVREKIDLGVAWKRPNEEGMATDIKMITGGDMRKGRWDERTRSVQLYAHTEERHAYRFVELPDTIFVPYLLRDTSAVWGETPASDRRWTLPDGTLVGASSNCAVTVAIPAKATDPVSRVTFSRAGEKFELPLSFSGRIWREDAISTRVTGVPAACWENARIAPIISVRTTAPDECDFSLDAKITDREGRARFLSEEEKRKLQVRTLHGKGSVYLPEFCARETREVEWSLLHCGKKLSGGVWRLQHVPYRELPTSVSGEALKIGEVFTTLVVPRAASQVELAGKRHEKQTFDRMRAWLVTEDGGWKTAFPSFGDCLTLGGEQADEGEIPGHHALLAYTRLANRDDIRSIVYVPTATRKDVEDLDSFECRVSAMIGLLSSPATGNKPLLVVIPPPRDVLPDCGCNPRDGKSCPHASQARRIAQRVMRAADAQGVPTLDLFTAFQTADAPAPFVSYGQYTDAGLRYIRSFF